MGGGERCIINGRTEGNAGLIHGVIGIGVGFQELKRWRCLKKEELMRLDFVFHWDRRRCISEGGYQQGEKNLLVSHTKQGKEESRPPKEATRENHNENHGFKKNKEQGKRINKLPVGYSKKEWEGSGGACGDSAR